MSNAFISFAAVAISLVFVGRSQADEDGYTPLLDAIHDTDWKHAGAGEMRVESGVATTFTPKESPLGGVYYYQKKRFSDFSVRLQFRVDSPTSNSGVFVRIGNPAAGYDAALSAGYEVDIYGLKTGTILALPNRLRPTHTITLQASAWNDLEVEVIDQHYVVRVNGQTVNDFSGERSLAGYLALQNYPGDGETHFRNVRIKELASASPSSGAAEKTPAGPERTAVEELSRQAPNATEWALAPLQDSVPGDIRQNLTFLREDLLDEARKAPKGSGDTYKLGADLCSAILGVLEERRQAQARANFRAVEAETRTTVTSQALEARRNYQMRWPQFEREKLQREELKKGAVNQAEIIKERPRLEWVERTAVLRRNLEAQYAKFRAAARQMPAE